MLGMRGGRVKTASTIWSLIRELTLVTLLMGTVNATTAEAADVSWVAGPVQLAPGGSALARLWLPAGQRAARLTFLGDRGAMLGQVDVEARAGTGAFFEIVVEAAYDGSTLKITDITDGTSNTIVAHDGSQGIIAILIGLVKAAGGPRAPMATLQILGSEGQTPLMLPFVEQDNG
jgi:hypothetical protein